MLSAPDDKVSSNLKPKPIEEARNYLEVVSRQWDGALARLKSYLERTSDETAQ